MLRINKEIRIHSQWIHMEGLNLSLPEQDEIAFWSAACTEASSSAPRAASRYVEMEKKFYEAGEVVSLSDKTLLRFRAAIGPRFFDSKLGDWPFDKADVFADPESAQALLDEFDVTGISMFVWRMN